MELISPASWTLDPGPDDVNVVLLKWSSEGTPLMGWVGLSDFNDLMYDVAVDQQGRIYLAVTTTTAFEFAGQSIQFASGTYVMCMLRLLPDGTEDDIWPSFGTSDSRIYSIAASPQNEIWFGGFERDIILTPFGVFNAYGDQYDRDGFLVKLDANADEFTAYTRITGSGWQFIRDIDISASGYVYAGADIAGSIATPVYYGMDSQLTDAMAIDDKSQPAVGRLENLICNPFDLFAEDSLALCPNASFTLQVEMPIFTSQWSDGSLLGEYTVTQPNVVGVSVVTQPGCILVDEVEIVAASQPEVDVTTSPVTCFGGNDGSANWTWVEGWNYTWNAMPLASLPNELSAGMYNLEVINTEGCSTVVEVLIAEPEPIQVYYNYQLESNGYLTAWVEQINGGQAPYALQWLDIFGNPVDTLLNVGQGQYSLQVIDAAGCSTQVVLDLWGAVEMHGRRDVQLYPNPCADQVNIEFAPGAFEEFTLYTQMGKELKRWKPSQTIENISLLDFPSAVYLLKGKTHGQESVYLQLVKHD